MSGPKGVDYFIGDGSPSLAGDVFVVIKASEGTGFPPPGAPEETWYPQQQARVRAAGDVFGAFLFWHPSADNAAQLANFQRHANLKPGDVIQLDAEVTDGLPWPTVNARKNDMLARLKAAYPQCRVLLYTYLDFWNHIDGNVADGLWIADPDAPAGAPRVPHWVIHQYGSGGVDYDIANFPDATALRAWAAGLIPKTLTPEGTMPLLLDVQSDPANPTVNQGIWYQDGALLCHVVDPSQLPFFKAIPNVHEGPVSFAQFQAIKAGVAALTSSVTVTVDPGVLAAAITQAAPQLAAAVVADEPKSFVVAPATGVSAIGPAASTVPPAPTS